MTKTEAGFQTSMHCIVAYARLWFLLCHAGKKGREGPGQVRSGVRKTV